MRLEFFHCEFLKQFEKSYLVDWFLNCVNCHRITGKMNKIIWKKRTFNHAVNFIYSTVIFLEEAWTNNGNCINSPVTICPKRVRFSRVGVFTAHVDFQIVTTTSHCANVWRFSFSPCLYRPRSYTACVGNKKIHIFSIESRGIVRTSENQVSFYWLSS